MTQQEKIERAVDELVAGGVWRATAAPPPHRLLWRLGLPVPPPHYQSFRSLLRVWGLFLGLLVACGYGVILSFSGLNRRNPLMLVLAGAAVGALLGLLMGLVVAAYYRRSARLRGLGVWEVYTPSEPEDEAAW
jgi:ABC-type Fe3+-siderophore transport system permease subunit